MQMETTSVNTKISTQTEDIKTTKDKCVASTLKYKNKKKRNTRLSTSNPTNGPTNHDLLDAKVIKVKICKK